MSIAQAERLGNRTIFQSIGKADMLIHINGEKRQVTEGTQLETLLKELDISTVGTAVELNREVVPKRTYAKQALTEGDVVEIIRMVGGG